MYLSRAHVALEDGVERDASLVVDTIRGGRITEFGDQYGSVADLPFEFALPADTSGSWLIILLPFEIGEDGFSHVICTSRVGETIDAGAVEVAVRPVFDEAAPYGVKAGRWEHVLVDDQTWRLLGAVRAAGKLGGTGKELWYDGRREAALSLMQEVATLVQRELPAGTTLPAPICRLFNDLAFMELAAGRTVEAQRHFEQLAVRGGLLDDAGLEGRVNLLCNLAAASAGVGMYVEAIQWADQCLGLAGDAQTTDLRTGVLAVYLPDPDWPRSPLLVDHPSPFEVAAATRASALAQIDDVAAVDAARNCAFEATESWACDLLEKVGSRLNRVDLVAEAEVCRANIPADGPNRSETAPERTSD